MVTIQGVYDGADTPKRIYVNGHQREIERIRGAVTFPPDSLVHAGRQRMKQAPDGGWVPEGADESWGISAPASKQLVHDISKHVEVTCDDERLIDWMKQ